MLIFKRELDIGPKVNVTADTTQRRLMTMVAVQQIETVDELISKLRVGYDTSTGKYEETREISRIIIQDFFVDNTIKSTSELARTVSRTRSRIGQIIRKLGHVSTHPSRVKKYAADIIGSYDSIYFKNINEAVDGFLSGDFEYDFLVRTIKDSYYNMDVIIDGDDDYIRLGIGMQNKLDKCDAIKVIRALNAIREGTA